ncbi:MAG TPA: thiamine pyrophosphate-dependent dehydrogenase E1 component subunit alpha [Gemmataceae bacterium]|nr:thiamine pyrophosphate-dependent dehydrogenase E1 component subunit alpha [Gemmataceae bacterium]
MTAPDQLLRFFHDMLRIRMVEETIAEQYPAQEMRCPVHLSIGQEAAAVGVCSALRTSDAVLSTHRSHAHYLAKGGNLKGMLAEIYGRATGCVGGRGGSMHLLDIDAGFWGAAPIVGATVPVGVGVAFADQMQQRDRVTVVFLGDGTVEEGVVHESLNFASLHKLPVIFACENNQYSVYTHLRDRQPPRPITEWAKGYGLPAASCDGNDVERVFGLTVDAVKRARGNAGPTFLEFATYRWREHCGPAYDNHIGYRSEEEFAAWRERCPIETMKTRMFQRDWLNSGGLAKMTATIRAEIDEAIRFAKQSEFPQHANLTEFIYAA